MKLPSQRGTWENLIQLGGRSYKCGYCDHQTGTNTGYICRVSNGSTAQICICGGCNRPTYFIETHQTPSPILGNKVEKLPDDLNTLYEEARKCTSLEAYTACVLCCRKILMHIAVDKGAGTTKEWNFLKYVEYLESNHYIPPNGKAWVDYIRTKGNEANHEIVIMAPDDASRLLTFVEMLLKFIYEFGTLITP